MLFNEPKLLKCTISIAIASLSARFSALQRAEIAEMTAVLVLLVTRIEVSVLFNEPKLLKSRFCLSDPLPASSFSALQRAEIAEIVTRNDLDTFLRCFSALQRAEIAEIVR